MQYYNDIYQQLFLGYSLGGLVGVGGGVVNAAWFSLLICEKNVKRHVCNNIAFLHAERPQTY